MNLLIQYHSLYCLSSLLSCFLYPKAGQCQDLLTQIHVDDQLLTSVCCNHRHARLTSRNFCCGVERPMRGSRYSHSSLIIRLIAIAYCRGQILKPVFLCPCVRLRALSRSHLDFYQNWHRRKNPKVKTSSFGVNIAPLFPHFATKNPHFRRRGLQNTCKY